jgi:hypothetical protein
LLLNEFAVGIRPPNNGGRGEERGCSLRGRGPQFSRETELLIHGASSLFKVPPPFARLLPILKSRFPRLGKPFSAAAENQDCHR